MPKLILPRNWRLSVTNAFQAFARNDTPGNVASFSTTVTRNGYQNTVNNLKIGKHTRVLYQGFTGRQATANAQDSIDYGTNVVGGVKPGVEGEHLGLPVLPSVKVAVQKLKPDASAIYVPGNGTVQAMEEAIENEIPLIVAVAEHIPLHDILRIHQILKTQSKTRLVGANCPGIINTWGKCRIGFQPLPFFKEGNVGIVAKSGTLSYEAVASTTRAGLGQSYGISMGGDVIAGTNFVEAFQVLEHDDNTEGIIMIGELGGRAEIDAAEWVKEYRRRTPNPKPFMACIGGITSPAGRIMGHAGAWRAPGEATAREKIAILEQAGIEVVDHPEKLGEGMKRLLAERKPVAGASGPSGSTPSGRRGYHTIRVRPTVRRKQRAMLQQTRSLIIKQSQALDLLKEKNIAVSNTPVSGLHEKLLTVTIDRTNRQACISASPTTEPEQMFKQAKKFPFSFTDKGKEASSPEFVKKVASHLGVSDASKELTRTIAVLVDLFMSKEAFLLETKITISDDGKLKVQGARFGFDDAAFRTSKRQGDIHALRDLQAEVTEEVTAEAEGMVYVKYDGEGSIGTIVNGAGLAMNTVDALMAKGGHPANFMDTGGKATSDTIKAGFKIVTSDPRVKVIFVNIFGGLTLGDMIANGIIMAFKDLNLTLPVVVRIRGTNERKGQDLITNSGLKIDAYDSFDDAAVRAIALARGAA